ncbi:MAG: hypothetical protein GY771_11295 [bacterium]|nr:hypothetical protein [bacterium]
MRLPVVVVLIGALTGAAGARTIVIDTDPSGLRVYTETDYLGKAPITLDLPLLEPITIIVDGKEGEIREIIEPISFEEGDRIILIAEANNKKDLYGLSHVSGLVIGLLAGVALVLTTVDFGY